MTLIKHPLVLASTFLWIGFVCAISFLEAWLKFRAPGVTIPIGLGIGKLVFAALNKIEWILSFIILCSLLFKQWQWRQWQSILILLPIGLLVVQTIWLLPELDTRATLRIMGETTPPSNLHFYYVGTEVLKVFSLLLSGIKTFKPKTYE